MGSSWLGWVFTWGRDLSAMRDRTLGFLQSVGFFYLRNTITDHTVKRRTVCDSAESSTEAAIMRQPHDRRPGETTAIRVQMPGRRRLIGDERHSQKLR
ncbi:MAG: hypothetical protein ACI92S_000611 [Planctomycetaceae bacterium]